MADLFSLFRKGEVNKLCKKGWRTQGGVSVATDETTLGRDIWMFQAMVKDDEPKN